MSTQFTNRQWRLPNNENKDKQSNYSMDFDGVNGTGITTGSLTDLSISDTFSFSLWVKLDSVQQYKHILANSHFGNGFALLVKSVGGNLVWGFHVNGWNSNFINDSSAIVANQWYHIAVSWNNTNGAKMYINNGSEITGLSGTTLGNLSTNIVIGASSSVQYAPIGQIDGVSIFNYELSSSQVTTLYGSSSTGIGNPMTLNPVAFYNLGDKSAFNGANYLVPNIAAEEADGDIATSFSPYALDFDSASSDYIQINNGSSLTNGFSELTVSIWANFSSLSTNMGLISKDLVNQRSFDFRFITSSGVNLLVSTDGVNNSQTLYYPTSSITTGVWYNFIGTYDGSKLSIYVNGSLIDDTITLTGSLQNTTSNLYVGTRGYLTSNSFNGQLSNASIWNTALTSAQVSEIYSEGIPQNLNNHSAVSSLVSWWQLGSNSSFNSSLNQWTCIDEKGTNTGESSQTFNEDAIVDGVGSYANGLSSGMGGDEVIGDAPYSSSNSLSVNMDVLDRVTDTPS